MGPLKLTVTVLTCVFVFAEQQRSVVAALSGLLDGSGRCPKILKNIIQLLKKKIINRQEVMKQILVIHTTVLLPPSPLSLPARRPPHTAVVL